MDKTTRRRTGTSHGHRLGTRAEDLSAAHRAQSIAGLQGTSAADPLDVLVVGGGVTGAGAAVDAASRGLSVGLLEAQDWAQGTSSRSSKLMHGGLRYLEMLDFALVAEALKERDLLLTVTAPHLVKPVAFVFPFATPFLDRAYIGSGVLLYDTLAGRPGRKRAVPVHRHLGRKALREHVPGLSEQAAVGALEYYDAKVDDARFVLTLVRSAAALGAQAASHVRVVDYLRDATGRVAGVRARDQLTGREFVVHARHVVLAGGVWTEEQQDLATSRGGLQVLASKGVHVTVPRDRIAAAPDTGIITKTEKSVLFVIPWDDYWVIGTTDTPWEEDVDAPVATSADIDYVLARANTVLAEPLTRADVIGVYAGLRPLLQPVVPQEAPEEVEDPAAGSTKVSREHTVMEVEPGLVAIAGGKFTTYRVMARDVIDFAVRDDPGVRDSETETLPLLGARNLARARMTLEQAAETYGWEPARVDRLLMRYGSLAKDLLRIIELGAQEPSHTADLHLPLEGAPRYLRVEAVHAAVAEGVVHLVDVLERRMRLNYEVPDRGVAAAEEVADLVAPVLDWDEERIAREIADFRAHVAAERAAEEVTTDAEAAHLVMRAIEGSAAE
ncbi:glycerol-3-phosphate dehydrogenase/oxidase [Brevibacterium litoralis]|uniref:glycerol-3-phosphate dehydrogenase/oxidase n=1 Tax=Brevibacterium litoralis TaxID=3138935 RepID=UPI0032EB4EC1